MTATAPREPRQDRSRATRQRLVETAVTCLSELGWSGTTVTVVAERAGVSRGAAQHHFRTHEDLITVAVDHILDAQLLELRAAAAALPTEHQRTESVLEIIVSMYTGPLFRATLHLWVAASADEHLRQLVAPLERRVGRAAHQLALDLLGVDEAVPGARETVQGTLDMARGLGLAGLLTDDSERRRRILREWAHTLDTVLQSSARTI